MKRRAEEAADPYLEACLRLRWRETSLSLLAPHSVFSSGRIDGGTRLLLDALPDEPPGRFLDLGCGYGAIGLSIAARFPGARGILVDRDLLAVEFARRNVERLGLRNVDIAASLGFSALERAAGPFDWIVANLPARVGEGVVAHFVAGSAGRLSAAGAMFVVIIAPLREQVVRAAERSRLSVRTLAATSRHAVFALRLGGETPRPSRDAGGPAVYRRDTVSLELPDRLRLDRPTDLADEPHRLAAAIPLLADSLPEEAPERALAFRPGYGFLPALLLARYARTRVVALDRDLLATAFTRWNCGEWGDRLRIVEAVDPRAASTDGPFDLVVGEILPPLGPGATAWELSRLRSLLHPGRGGRRPGTGLIAGQLRPLRELVRSAGRELGLRVAGTRGPAGLLCFGPS